VLTAKRGDFAVSVLAAALGELPIAAVLIFGTLRIARLQGSPVGRARWLFRVRREPSGRSARSMRIRRSEERSTASAR